MAKTAVPLLEAARIQSEINRLFNNLLDLGGEGKEAGAWIPNVDIVETDGALLVKVELPGVEAPGLTVSVLGGNLILKGEKARIEPDPGAKFQLVERAFGRFRRVIALGVPVNTHRAEAQLKDGLLRVRFPKVPNRRGEEVSIQVNAS